jgi:hypothetical protein
MKFKIINDLKKEKLKKIFPTRTFSEFTSKYKPKNFINLVLTREETWIFKKIILNNIILRKSELARKLFPRSVSSISPFYRKQEIVPFKVKGIQMTGDEVKELLRSLQININYRKGRNSYERIYSTKLKRKISVSDKQVAKWIENIDEKFKENFSS